LLLEHGGIEILPRVKEICAEELGWDDSRWAIEADAYLETWKRCYRPPMTDRTDSAESVREYPL